jgi:prepilin-type N-terminal cleavage/methylation domain-containing protein
MSSGPEAVARARGPGRRPSGRHRLTASSAPGARQDEEGFTLIELVVAMTLMLVVLGATVTAFEALARTADRTQRTYAAQDRAQAAVDQLAAQLRNAVAVAAGGAPAPAALERATATDLVFQQVDPRVGPSPASPGGWRRVRYCLDATDPANEAIYRQVQVAPSGAPPAGTACPAAGWDAGRTVVVADRLVNAQAPSAPELFAYGPSGASSLSAIASVLVNVLADPDPGTGPPAARLTTAVALRNLNRRPVAHSSCAPRAGGSASCDAWGSADPDGQLLSYAWTLTAGTACAANPVAGEVDPQVTLIGLTPGQAYAIGLTVTDAGGLASAPPACQVVTAQP